MRIQWNKIKIYCKNQQNASENNSIISIELKKYLQCDNDN